MKNIQHYLIFTDENLYLNQIHWILKQIESCKDDSFNDLAKAKLKLGELTIINLDKEQSKRQLQCNLMLAENNLHGFRNSFLSEAGFSRLNTTLKVARKRLLDKANGAKKLDVTVSHDAFERLDDIVKDTGLTKTAIIEKLILDPTFRTNVLGAECGLDILDYDSRLSSQYKEEQLEFNIAEKEVT